MPFEVPKSLLQTGRRLAPCTNVCEGNVHPCSGEERVTYAYRAGRQAARYLRGEDRCIEPKRFVMQRSPACYLVLQGCDPQCSYPKLFRTFTEYKGHVFTDGDKARPSHFHPDSASCGFYSEVEANAFALGAGLEKLPR